MSIANGKLEFHLPGIKEVKNTGREMLNFASISQIKEVKNTKVA
jgi:hypothetical protein